MKSALFARMSNDRIVANARAEIFAVIVARRYRRRSNSMR
jgi:hypothetical protein